MVKKGSYQHFRPDEHTFLDKIDDYANRVEETYLSLTTEFLNPRQVLLVKNILSQRGLTYFISSDYYPTEYAKVIIAPDYYSLDQGDFEISLLEIDYNSKFNNLTHSQIMGTLLNQLGIRRSVLGDIILGNGCAQVLIDKGMATYVTDNISKIGRASIIIKEVPLSKLIETSSQKIESAILVSSMRLDKIISSALKLSRSQAIKLIEAEKVKLNYGLVNSPSELVQIGDLLSIRGFGRVSILSENGLSKSGKYKLTVEKTLHK